MYSWQRSYPRFFAFCLFVSRVVTATVLDAYDLAKQTCGLGWSFTRAAVREGGAFIWTAVFVPFSGAVAGATAMTRVFMPLWHVEEET